MEFSIVLRQVLILFIILVIGSVASKFNILDSNGSKKISEILLYIATPMMIFSSFFIELSQELLVNVIWVLGFSTIMFIVSIILSKHIYRKFNINAAPILRFTAVFSNCGYMGIPLMKAVFGDEGAFYGSFYVVIFYVFLWSYGYIILGEKDTMAKTIKRVLLNPSMIAVYVGTIVFLFNIPVPEVIKGAAKSVGDMTMPLSMLIVGAATSNTRFVSLFSDWKVYVSSLVRLVLMPVLAFLISLLAGVPSLPSIIIVTALAMPAAATVAVFAETFDKDTVFASKCVTVSNLLSIITIPAIISWVASYS